MPLSRLSPVEHWESLRLQEPIISAPMAGVSGGSLASAVSRAGGLGLVAVGHGAAPAFIAEQLSLVKTGTEQGPGLGPGTPGAGQMSRSAWGVGLMSWSLAREDQAALLQCLDFAPPVVALAAGDPSLPARLAKEAGAFVAVQVGTEEEVRLAAADPHIDLVVVRGAEGGGHGLNGPATLPLLQYATHYLRSEAGGPRRAIGAAGGIGTPEGVAAVLASGADAAWVGTRFIPCSESLASEAIRASVTAASLGDTVYTSVFDLALDLPWPAEYGGRALRNRVTDAWAARQDELRDALGSKSDAQPPSDPPVPALHQDPSNRSDQGDHGDHGDHGDQRTQSGHGITSHHQPPQAPQHQHTAEASALQAQVRAARAQGDPSAAPVYAGQSAGLIPASAPGFGAADVVKELATFRQNLEAAARRWPASLR